MIERRFSPHPVPYEDAINFMNQRVRAIHQANAPEMLWFLEHPSLYTAGTGAKISDLKDTRRLPVYDAGRGGQYTYHGPGQRVVYVMIDLAKRQRDVRAFVVALEQWIIDTLAVFAIRGERRTGRIGIWVTHQEAEWKIAALGIRIRRWVSLHGIAINVNPDLSHFEGIVPCGLPGYGVTSCAALGVPVTLKELDKALQQQWQNNDFLTYERSPLI